MASGTTVGGESARYCDTSILTKLLQLRAEFNYSPRDFKSEAGSIFLNPDIYVGLSACKVVEGYCLKYLTRTSGQEKNST